MKEYDYAQLNARFEAAPAEEVVRWAVGELSPLCMSTSFGAESAVLLHLVTRIKPDIPVLFTNTGFHFKETLEHRDRLVEKLKLNLRELKPETPTEEFLAKNGRLYERDPDACCAVNKIAPFEKGLRDYAGWISGIRRAQAATREKAQFVENYRGYLVKVNPLLNWNGKMFWDYAKQYGLPYHPLWEKGYLSIGCSPETCTRPASADGGIRSGRWTGQNKVECGIHTFLKIEKDQAREQHAPK
ncbi:MAG TPA: phosphoadenylyl-sulfate reductase [bacterium]|nr:phosphoadenylyl-sulfate reductase [bacterium]